MKEVDVIADDPRSAECVRQLELVSNLRCSYSSRGNQTCLCSIHKLLTDPSISEDETTRYRICVPILLLVLMEILS